MADRDGALLPLDLTAPKAPKAELSNSLLPDAWSTIRLLRGKLLKGALMQGKTRICVTRMSPGRSGRSGMMLEMEAFGSFQTTMCQDFWDD